MSKRYVPEKYKTHFLMFKNERLLIQVRKKNKNV